MQKEYPGKFQSGMGRKRSRTPATASKSTSSPEELREKMKIDPSLQKRISCEALKFSKLSARRQ